MKGKGLSGCDWCVWASECVVLAHEQILVGIVSDRFRTLALRRKTAKKRSLPRTLCFSGVRWRPQGEHTHTVSRWQLISLMLRLRGGFKKISVKALLFISWHVCLLSFWHFLSLIKFITRLARLSWFTLSPVLCLILNSDLSAVLQLSKCQHSQFHHELERRHGFQCTHSQTQVYKSSL